MVDASSVLRVVAVVEVSDNVIDSLPNPVIPDEAYAVFIAAIPPVKSVSALASTVPVVFESRRLTASTVLPVLVIVTALSDMFDTPEAVKAMLSSSTDPVSVVTEAASTVPVVVPFSALKSDAESVVSVSVTVSLPKPVNPGYVKAV